MPELPEVEITARLLDAALKGAAIESALAPGINALKTFDPLLSELDGREIVGVRRRGKHLIVDVSGELALLIHLMSAGRLQLYDKLAGPRDRTSRLLLRVGEGRERGDCVAVVGDLEDRSGIADLLLITAAESSTVNVAAGVHHQAAGGALAIGAVFAASAAAQDDRTTTTTSTTPPTSSPSSKTPTPTSTSTARHGTSTAARSTR